MATNLPVYYRKRWLIDRQRAVTDINKDVNLQLVGCEVRIVSRFNGQPYGRSKAAKTGQVFKIAAVYLDDNGTGILLEGLGTSCGLEDIKFI
jgi:hypothetical protein